MFPKENTVLRALLSAQEPPPTPGTEDTVPSWFSVPIRPDRSGLGQTLLVAKPATTFPLSLAGQAPALSWCPQLSPTGLSSSCNSIPVASGWLTKSYETHICPTRHKSS